jgi:hypothetical protein
MPPNVRIWIAFIDGLPTLCRKIASDACSLSANSLSRIVESGVFLTELGDDGTDC